MTTMDALRDRILDAGRKRMTYEEFESLPLSQCLRMCKRDLQICELEPGMGINLAFYHACRGAYPLQEDDVRWFPQHVKHTVCFAGAAMYRSLTVPSEVPGNRLTQCSAIGMACAISLALSQKQIPVVDAAVRKYPDAIGIRMLGEYVTPGPSFYPYIQTVIDGLEAIGQ